MNPIQELIGWDQTRRERFLDFFLETLGISAPLFLFGVAIILYVTKRHAITALISEWWQGRRPKRSDPWGALEKEEWADARLALLSAILAVVLAIVFFFAGY